MWFGAGQYGVVRLGKDTVTNKTVAIKYVDLVANDEYGLPTSSVREIAALSRCLKNPYTVELLDIFMTNNHIAVVLEFGGEDLESLLSRGLPDVVDKFQLAVELCKAVASIHEDGIVHRDLKPQNILVDPITNMLKIIDFGLSKIEMNEYDSVHTTYCRLQTLWYRAPEMLMQYYASHTSRIDVWSVGCIISQLYTGKPLLAGMSEEDQLRVIFCMCGTPGEHILQGLVPMEGTGVPLSPDMPDPIRDVLPKMLVLDPSRRCSMKEALATLCASVST